MNVVELNNVNYKIHQLNSKIFPLIYHVDLSLVLSELMGLVRRPSYV